MKFNSLVACPAFIDMQREYAAVGRNVDGLPQHAGRWFSTQGRRDGLSWPTHDGEALAREVSTLTSLRFTGANAAGGELSGA